jgi:hypothetical protein
MYNRFNPAGQATLDPLGITSFAPKIPTVVEGEHAEGSSLFPPGLPPHPYPPGYDPLDPLDYPDYMPPNRNTRREYSSPFAMTQPHLAVPYANPESLTEDHYLICSPLVRGYSLKLKTWGKKSSVSHKMQDY